MAACCRGVTCGCGPAARALYAETKALERKLGDVAWAAFRLGDDAQRAAVDVAFDLATLSVGRLAARASDWAGALEESARGVGSAAGLDLAAEQARNNFEVYNLVKNVRVRLGFDVRADLNLLALVDAAYALGPYADLWAIEGLGHDYTTLRLDRDGVASGIMSEGAAAALPASTLTMMHAGLGLALAERMLPRLTPCDSRQRFGDIVAEYLAACDAHGRPGYRGAAYESLGLVARTWHPQLVASIDQTLRVLDERAAAFFWHGAGRALYFLPAYIVPVLSTWRAVDREAPDALARVNLAAGLAWAWTLVNIRQPRILAGLLRTRGDPLERNPGFAHGVTAALVVAGDLTPDDSYVTAFAHWTPDGGAADAWHRVIATAARAAARYRPVLRQHAALEEVFRFGDLAALVARLERGDAASVPPPRSRVADPRVASPTSAAV